MFPASSTQESHDHGDCKSRPCQLPSAQEFFSLFHSSYFQCSQEQEWPAIKTLLKHFWCCQRPRGGVPGPNAEMLSPRSSSLPLSILRAGRCKMNNNLIWASKFYGAFSRQERWEVGLALQHIIWPSLLNLLKPFKTASLHSDVLKGWRKKERGKNTPVSLLQFQLQAELHLQHLGG